MKIAVVRGGAFITASSEEELEKIYLDMLNNALDTELAGHQVEYIPRLIRYELDWDREVQLQSESGFLERSRELLQARGTD